jgi:hypothetical protein
MAERLRVAYVMPVHRDPAQVSRLIHRLAVPGTAFVIHVDAKSGTAVEGPLREATASVPNVHFIESRPVHWAHFSLLDSILRALAALRDLGLDPDQTVTTTGQDYPIAPPEEIARRLSVDAELSFIQHSKLPNYDWWPNDRGGLDRLERVYVRLPRRGMVNTPIRRRVPHGWQPYGGSIGLCLGRPHREYMVDLLERDRGLRRHLRGANIAEEWFFQTVLMNSPLRDSVVDDNLLFTRWQPLANHPDSLGIADLDEILASGKLFARKFHATHDPEVLDELERRVDAGA